MSTNGTKPSAEWELITPELAAVLLERNDNNRNRRSDRVDKYGRAMSLGDWGLTGQPIIIDRNGNLMDGQHRLMAVVDTGISVWFLVVRGVDPELMPLVDKGLARTAGDAFAWAGVPNSNMVAAAIRQFLALIYGTGSRDSHALNTITDQEMLDAFAEHEAFITWAAPIATSVAKSIKLSASQYLAAMLWLSLNECKPETIQEFSDQIVTGANLGEGSPILAFRNWALNIKVTKRRLRKDEILIAVVKTWNEVAEGRRRKLMKVHHDEVLPDIVPR
jgi:hypothetical protein